MSILEGARKDLFFSDLSSEDLRELESIDPTMDLANWSPKEHVFSSPHEEIKWRTDKLLKDMDGFAWMKPDFKPPKLDDFKQRVEQAISDAAIMDVSTEKEFEVCERVRKLSEEMKEIQYGSKERMWAVFEEMDREIQADPGYLDKIGVPRIESDEDEEDFGQDEEDIESSDDEEWVNDSEEQSQLESNKVAGKRPA